MPIRLGDNSFVFGASAITANEQDASTPQCRIQITQNVLSVSFDAHPFEFSSAHLSELSMPGIKLDVLQANLGLLTRCMLSRYLSILLLNVCLICYK